MSDDTAIVVRELRYAYPNTSPDEFVIDIDAFDCMAGESVAVIDPSGSGKSTLLGLINGMLQPTAGTIEVRAAGPMSLIVQDSPLVPFLSVAENVCLAAELHQTTSGSAAITKCLDRLGIAHLSTRLPHQISGGERQRAAIAQALISCPRVVLADEPTGSLDSANSRAVAELLAGLAAENDVLVVVATHDETVWRQCGRVLQLDSGHPSGDVRYQQMQG